MEFINSMLYLVLLFSITNTGGNNNESGGNILGGGNSFIFLAVILLCLKDVEDCICEPGCHCDHCHGHGHDHDRIAILGRGGFFEDDFFPRRRPFRDRDFI